MKKTSLFKLLEKKQKKRKAFKESDEYSFFLEHRHLLRRYPRFAFLFDKEKNDFEVMRGNIIINAFLNKENLELEIASLSKKITSKDKIDHLKYIATIKERLLDAPYLAHGKEKIYIPIFNSALNEIYLRNPEKLLEEPYASLVNDYRDVLVDPFDTYGAKLFDSSFTRLINVGTDGKIIAFFHYDTNTIYFVNNQGRLDHKIVCFDKYLTRAYYNHMLERIKPVVEAYFANSRSDLLVQLHKNGLISSRMLSEILTSGER